MLKWVHDNFPAGATLERIGKVESGNYPLPRLSEAGTVSRTGRPGQAAFVPGMGLLGQAGSGVRRSACGAADTGACARGAWSESHGTHVPRRSVLRFSLPGPVSRGICESAHFDESRRRSGAEECLYGRDFALRASCQQAFAYGARELPALFGARDRDFAAARGAGVGQHCDAGLFGIVEREQVYCNASCVSFSARGSLRAAGRFASFVCFLSSEPAEYFYWQADGRDVV